MSNVAITGNASGTGVFTVASPNSNTDRVLTLPDETGTVDTLQRSGNVIQVVNFQTGALASGTGLIPRDDTIPQITEGDQYMTLAITPTNESNILLINVVVAAITRTVSPDVSVALFVGATANALASSIQSMITDGTVVFNFTHKMVAGVTTELTFRVRAGGADAGTTRFNAFSAVERHGGVLASSITITEVTP